MSTWVQPAAPSAASKCILLLIEWSLLLLLLRNPSPPSPSQQRDPVFPRRGLRAGSLGRGPIGRARRRGEQAGEGGGVWGARVSGPGRGERCREAAFHFPPVAPTSDCVAGSATVGMAVSSLIPRADLAFLLAGSSPAASLKSSISSLRPRFRGLSGSGLASLKQW